MQSLHDFPRRESHDTYRQTILSHGGKEQKNYHHSKSEHAREQGRICQDAIKNQVSAIENF